MCKGVGGCLRGSLPPSPLIFQGFFPALRWSHVSFPLCRVSLRDVNPLFIYFSWKLTSCCILMTPGPGVLTKMLNIRSLSVILQRFWRGRGVQALLLNLRFVCRAGTTPSNPLPSLAVGVSFLASSLWENPAPELNPAALPFLPPRPHGTSSSRPWCPSAPGPSPPG